MPQQRRIRLFTTALTAALLGIASSARAQVTPAAGYTPPDDTPVIRIGATIFADYTYQTDPKGTDVDGNSFSPNAFNVGRAYINVTGNINHMIAFRITPDIVRETIAGAANTGSYVYRLKYAYGQFNLDDWMTRGSWARFGMQQTPFVDYSEQIYRYRFQGTIFEEREGFLSSSDTGVSFHYNFKNNYGDFHTGIYNGENYNRAEVNGEKGWMTRGTFRPLPMGSPAIRGLRVSGFYDADHYVKSADRSRGILSLSYEHPYLNAAFDYLWASDQTRIGGNTPKLDSNGFTIWATPRSPKGWEGLVRFDHLDRDQATATIKAKTDRTIVGGSYWFPHQGNVSTALLLDYEQVNYDNFTPVRLDEKRIAVHMLVNF
jgi:hypothetical protein